MTTPLMSANDFRFYSTAPSVAPAMQSYAPDYSFQMPVAMSAPTSFDLASLTGAKSFGQSLSNMGIPTGAPSTYMTGPVSPNSYASGGTPGWGSKLAGWLGDGDNLNAAVGGIQALTGAYLGFQNLRLAKDNLRFQKDAWQKNYANQAQSYNTSLEDRTRARYSSRETDESKIQDYLNRNRLSKN